LSPPLKLIGQTPLRLIIIVSTVNVAYFIILRDLFTQKVCQIYPFFSEQTVKNISEPVRVYQVLMEPEAAGKVIGEKKAKPGQWHRATGSLE